MHQQGWPESLCPTPTPLLFQNFWIRIRVRKFFKFENPTPVNIPATIDQIKIYPCFYWRNDHADSCYQWRSLETCLKTLFLESRSRTRSRRSQVSVSKVSGLRSQYRRNSRSKRSVAKLSLLFCCLQDGENNLPSTPFKIYTEFNKKCACSLPMKPGLWSRKSHHPTPTPDNFDYPTPTPTPTPVRLRPSAVLVI